MLVIINVELAGRELLQQN